jgi:hypothetical protein
MNRQSPHETAFHGLRSRGILTEEIDLKFLYAVEGIIEGDRTESLMVLRRLKNYLPSVIRNTPHSCMTEEHCCSLHAAHNEAAEKVEQIIQAEIEKLEGKYVEPLPENTGPIL